MKIFYYILARMPCMLAKCMQIAWSMCVNCKYTLACKCLHVTCAFNMHAIGPNAVMRKAGQCYPKYYHGIFYKYITIITIIMV